jgi:PNKP (polynucleotide 5'-kinase/3'-phosphatase) family adenylyltransferase-like protein/Hen1-like subunit of RNA repair complex
MLLLITTTLRPATDLGFLLHKHPARSHELELAFGRAHMFYPEATEERCTFALLLDIDPVGLVRGSGKDGGLLDQYVNDRPYAASSFAIHPKWLIYLPPTMSPPATTARDGLLEHPDEAFAYYRDEGIGAVVVEEKHMGSRALIAICRDEAAARDRFGATTGETGAIYTRTGRAFFPERTTTEAVLARIRAAMSEVGFWERRSTAWALLDAGIMPWSAKAQSLIREQ